MPIKVMTSDKNLGKFAWETLHVFYLILKGNIWSYQLSHITIRKKKNYVSL